MNNPNKNTQKNKEFLFIFICFGILIVFLYNIMSFEDKNIMENINNENLEDLEILEEETNTSSNANYMVSGRTADILKYCEELDCKLNKTKDKCIYTEDDFTFGCPVICIESQKKCKNIQ